MIFLFKLHELLINTHKSTILAGPFYQDRLERVTVIMYIESKFAKFNVNFSLFGI